MYNHSNYVPRVREDLLDSIDRYAQQGVPMGDFLEAVLSNNLMESFGRADDGNRRALFSICEYIYNEIDGSCHGSSERVRTHLQHHLDLREKARTASNGEDGTHGNV